MEGKFKYFNKNQSWNFTVKFEMGKVKKVARKFKFIFDIRYLSFLFFGRILARKFKFDICKFCFFNRILARKFKQFKQNENFAIQFKIAILLLNLL